MAVLFCYLVNSDATEQNRTLDKERFTRDQKQTVMYNWSVSPCIKDTQVVQKS